MRNLILQTIICTGLTVAPVSLALGQNPGPARGPGVLRGGGSTTQTTGTLPEPATIALLAISAGGGGLLLRRRQRRNRDD
ncbi:MAG: PEP-CTERM sorting domain-containing protein [Planctomycetota bacterium]|jgi:hypothetical protein|nr:PEP-CTERM sorting domain-containing protein [Planctomycetota bacterium]